MPQLTYTQFPPNPRPGTLSDMGLNLKAITGVASVLIPFGRFVQKLVGTDQGIQLPGATFDPTTQGLGPLGVAMATQAIESQLSGTAPAGYQAKDAVNVARSAAIWVQCETAFDPDTAELYVRITESATGAADNGQVRNDSDSGKAVKLVKNTYRVLNTLTGAGLLNIEINLPN